MRPSACGFMGTWWASRTDLPIPGCANVMCDRVVLMTFTLDMLWLFLLLDILCTLEFAKQNMQITGAVRKWRLPGIDCAKQRHWLNSFRSIKIFLIKSGQLQSRWIIQKCIPGMRVWFSNNCEVWGIKSKKSHPERQKYPLKLNTVH